MRFLRIPDLNKEFSWQFFDQSSDFCPRTDPFVSHICSPRDRPVRLANDFQIYVLTLLSKLDENR